MNFHPNPPGWLVALVGSLALLGLVYNLPSTPDPPPIPYTLTCTHLQSQAGHPVIVFQFRSDTEVLFFERHFRDEQQAGELEHWENRCE